MPWSFEIDTARRVVVVTVSGEVADEDLDGMYEQLGSSAEVTPEFAMLVDLSAATGEAVTAEGVRALAKVPLVLSPESRRAVVVASELGFGMARMYQLLRESHGEVRVFRNVAEARLWVGLEGA